jgi:hypothetical protein
MAFITDFLEAEGRTGAIRGAVESAGEKALAMRRESREEAAATQEGKLTGIQIQQQQNVLDEQNRVKELRGNAFDITTTPDFQGASESGQANILKRFSEGGFGNAAGVGTVGSAMDFRATVESTKGLFEELAGGEVTEKRKLFDNAKLDRQEYEEKKKGTDLSRDKKYQDFLQIEREAAAEYNRGLDAFTQHSKAIKVNDEVEALTARMSTAKRKLYLETFKAVMNATGDSDEAKRIATETVREQFREEPVSRAEHPISREFRTVPPRTKAAKRVTKKNNPLGFTAKELRSLGVKTK